MEALNSSAATTGGALVSGVIAALLSVLGVEAGALFWALIGSILGVSFAVSTSRARAAIVFIAVTLSCSLFGTWIAAKWFGGEATARNVMSCALAIFFHPLLAAAVQRIPAILDALQRKIFGGPA